MGSFYKNITIQLCCLLCCLAIYSTPVSAAKKKAPKAPPSVVVHTITEQEINPYQEFVGRIEAMQAVAIQARVQGYLEEVAFREGSMVDAGQLLYKIEPDVYRAKVNVNRAKRSKCEAALTKAQQYYKRIKTVKRGGVSAADRDTAESDLLQAKANLQEAQANLNQSNLDLSYTTITSPIRGRIGKTSYTKGNLVSSSSGTLARIVQIDPIRATFSISENMLAAAQQFRHEPRNSKVIKLRMSGDRVYPLTGVLEFLDNEVDRTTGTVAVRAVFPNPDGLLVPGQYVTVLVGVSKPQKKAVVPQAAVLEDKDGKYVFVVDGNKIVQQKRIKIGIAKDTQWAVESGLLPGESVIVSGIQKVRPGMEVNPSSAKQ
ncbi:efflux RND transporter periplasmic adaptor subunit [Maridesulfovibrio sp.]|uniref:efflux RND transporter periplasmic adaptor subunit n=1 Tax=Maridesulfovibrio sp. TaxID=2795000 RepID=UPI0029CA4D5A|nr:efflux RND transporter periplasmic adaptor subunit [Maridesulfovibrio sp.]